MLNKLLSLSVKSSRLTAGDDALCVYKLSPPPPPPPPIPTPNARECLSPLPAAPPSGWYMWVPGIEFALEDLCLCCCCCWELKSLAIRLFPPVVDSVVEDVDVTPTTVVLVLHRFSGSLMIFWHSLIVEEDHLPGFKPR